MRPSSKRLVTRASVLTASAIALACAAHAPFARGLLRKVGGCPVSQASAADVEHARMVGVRATRGAEPAPARPALGFVLDVTTRNDVDRWAAAHHLRCDTSVEGMKLTCHAIPADALVGRALARGAIDELAFGFRPDGARLVNVRALTLNLSPDEGARRATSTNEALVAALGTPATGEARVDGGRLAAVGYATSNVTFRFADYLADVTATNIPGRGVLLREQYMSAVE